MIIIIIIGCSAWLTRIVYLVLVPLIRSIPFHSLSTD